MGFRQKSRGIRFGRWEYIALLLVGCTFASAAGWWRARNQSPWERATAQVIGLSLAENEHRIDASRPQLRIHYEFVVGGRRYGGKTPLDAFTRTIYRAVPPEAIALLRSKGYMSFRDLPPKVQEMLRQRGIERLDSVPEPLLETLRAQGVRSVRDFPDDFRAMAAQGDYEGLAREGAQALGESLAEPSAPSGAGGVSPAQSGQGSSAHSGIATLSSGAVIQVLYDPGRPSRHKVLRFPRVSAMVYPVLMGAFSLLTILYCGVFYPWVKQR